MMYYLYHIPGKKIGVTSNLNTRVTLIQGYKADEYEVLDSSTDMDYISDKEIELQKSYGYKVDRQSYSQLKTKSKKMKINATEQTSTFPFPLNKLKGNLMDCMGDTWKTENGLFELTQESIDWIMANAKVSMYNDKRSYIYNKAFYEAILSPVVTLFKSPELKNQRFDLIREWATERGLYEKGNANTQYIKLMEEAGELAQALLKNDEPEVIDAIGDIVVVLTNLAHLKGYKIEDCVDKAYEVISDRKGEMINGTFVKETL